MFKKRRTTILFVLGSLLVLLSALLILLYKNDPYFYLRYTDRLFDTLFHTRPFGGGPYENNRKGISNDGIYITQLLSDGKYHRTNASGIVVAVDKNKITLTDFGSTDVLELQSDAIFVMRVPDPDVVGKVNIVSSKIADIEVGDRIYCSNYDALPGFENIVIIKKFYDRDKI